MPTDFSTAIDDRVARNNSSTTATQPHFDIKRLLRLRTKTILLIAVVLAIPSMLGAWLLTPIVYTASAQLLFESTEPYVMINSGNRTGGQNYEKFVSTELSIIKGSTILSRVIEDPEVRKLPGLAQQPDLLTYLMGRVEA